MALTDQQLAEAGVGIAHFFGGGAYIKETRIPGGCELRQHAHPHDHLSYLAAGSVVVTVEGEPAELMEAPRCIVMKANKTHGVVALEDTTWLCVWSTDCTDPEKVDAEIEGTPV